MLKVYTELPHVNQYFIQTYQTDYTPDHYTVWKCFCMTVNPSVLFAFARWRYRFTKCICETGLSYFNVIPIKTPSLYKVLLYERRSFLNFLFSLISKTSAIKSDTHSLETVMLFRILIILRVRCQMWPLTLTLIFGKCIKLAFNQIFCWKMRITTV
jgi:hypothetical protein